MMFCPEPSAGSSCRNILEVPVKFSAAEQQAYDAIKQEFEMDEDEDEHGEDPASGSDTDSDSGQKAGLEVQTAPALRTVNRLEKRIACDDIQTLEPMQLECGESRVQNTGGWLC